MSDLISRGELLKRFLMNKDGHRIPERDCDNLEVTVSIKDVKTIIKEQPTAYDIDKIVEELKEAMQDLSVIEILSHIDFDSTIQSGLDNFLKAYNSELLRIVKHGCASDDVCEWTLDGVYLHSPHKPLVSCITDENYRYYYCPVCGKKIKVVE